MHRVSPPRTGMWCSVRVLRVFWRVTRGWPRWLGSGTGWGVVFLRCGFKAVKLQPAVALGVFVPTAAPVLEEWLPSRSDARALEFLPPVQRSAMLLAMAQVKEVAEQRVRVRTKPSVGARETLGSKRKRTHVWLSLSWGNAVSSRAFMQGGREGGVSVDESVSAPADLIPSLSLPTLGKVNACLEVGGCDVGVHC